VIYIILLTFLPQIAIFSVNISLRTDSKLCYGLLRTVTFCCVHPVLLRPTRFLIRTVIAVANFLRVNKSGPASTAITACHVYPSRPLALSHVNPVLSTVAGNGAAVAAGNMV
jgi:hypothetical protein